jgi:hypothetical protein
MSSKTPVDYLHRFRHRFPLTTLGLEDFVAPDAKTFAQERANPQIAAHQKNTAAAARCRVHKIRFLSPTSSGGQLGRSSGASVVINVRLKMGGSELRPP